MTIDVPSLLARLGIEARRKGRRWWARCPSPDHADDRDPSWMVRDDPDHDHHAHHVCYGCGFGGGAIALVREVLGLGPAEAREYLGGAEVERPPALAARVVARGERGGFTLPAGIVEAPLHRWPAPARRYLEGRGFGAEDAALFRLGYAVDGRCEGRIVFPVFGSAGRITSLVARTFVGATPKVWEPPSSGGATKANAVGQHLWPAPAERDLVVVCEGPFDALAAAAAGYCAAGVRGSSLDPRQVAAIATFRLVVDAGDPDPAGSKLGAELRAALARHRPVVRVALLAGEDLADVHARAGSAEVARLVRAATRDAPTDLSLRARAPAQR